MLVGVYMIKYTKFKDYMRHSFIQYAIILISFIFISFILFMIINFKVFTIKTNKDSNKKISVFFQQQYNVYYKNIESLSQNNVIKEFIFNNKDGQNTFSALYNFSNGQDIKSNFILLSKDENVKATNLYRNNIISFTNSVEANDIINRLKKDKNKVLCIPYRTNYDNGQKSNYIFAKCIMDHDIIVGYLMLQLRESDLNNFIMDTDANIISITDNFDNVIYSNNDSIVSSIGKYKPNVNSNNITNINGKDYYTVINNDVGNNINIITMTSVSAQKQFLFLGVIIIFIIGFFVIILVTFLANKMTNKNINAMNTLIEAIDECVNDNLQYRINLDTFEEFKILYDKFNNMIDKVQYLIDKNKEISERKRIMEIKHLEGQLNPHFVFNVLETLHYEILLDQQEAVRMLVSFAKLIRYNINYGNMEVELQADIEYVKNYLMLQKIRYNNRLEYSIDIDEDLMQYKIPKLVIQPIVENSLIHGIKDDYNLTINIKGEKLENIIKISIEDNGKGIEESEVKKLISLLNDENAMPENIGLYNVNRAIKLMYGDIYGAEIYSKYGFGTKVILKIPIIGGDHNV